MTYGIILLLEEQESQSLRKAFYDLDSSLLRLQIAPHISLALFDNADQDTVLRMAESLSECTAPFRVRFSSLGLFLGPENILFLSPVVTRELLQIHEDLYGRCMAQGLVYDERYRPGLWVPHCTLDEKVSLDKTLRDITYLAEHAPLGEYLVDRVIVAEFFPVVTLAEFSLQGRR